MPNSHANSAESIVDELCRQRSERCRVTPIRNYPAEAGLVSAYRAQDLLFARIHGSGGRIGGYKIGMGGRSIRNAYGLDEPASGLIALDEIRTSPASLGAQSYVHLAVECEIAVQMARSFESGNADDLLACVDSVCAAFEVVDDRHLDYGNIDVFTMVADNGWNAGLVTGGPSRDLSLLSVALEGHLVVGGRDLFHGTNTDTLTPLDALAWLAGHLVRRGRRLEAGDWVATGGLTACFPTRGDQIVFSAGRLPPVTVSII